jgi:hypothetical protein
MTVVIDGIEYLPASVAVQQLATTETKILMLLKQRVLGGELIEGSWFVTTTSLACYGAHAREPETLSRCRTSCGSSGCGCH